MALGIGFEAKRCGILHSPAWTESVEFFKAPLVAPGQVSAASLPLTLSSLTLTPYALDPMTL